MKTAKLSLLCLLTLLILVAALAGFRNAGRWLTREDPLSSADVIFVLSGGMPYRAEEAGKVFGMGYAPEVWVSRAESPARHLEELGVHFVGEEEYDREILIHEGVPAAVVHILPDPIVDTEQEVEEVAREMLERHSLTVESQTAALAGGWRRPGQVPWLSPIGP